MPPTSPTKRQKTATPSATSSPSGLTTWLGTERRQAGVGIGVLLLLTILQFADVLFTSGHPVASWRFTDMVTSEGPLRAFLTQTLHAGVFPLWNPYIFSGMPCFTAGQAPLLYPPTWLHLLLPLDKAINVIFALHVFWIGLGMYLWGLSNKFKPASALVGASMVMFGGPFFLHIYAGHVGNVSAMAWIPFLFLAVDMVFGGRYRAGLLIGSFALAMEVLASQPQYAYYAALALVVYVAIKLIKTSDRLVKIATVAGGIALGVGIAAAQIIAIIPQAGESIRNGPGLPIKIAGTFSFPPENLLTVLAPGIFGNVVNFHYWGRWYLWEASAFIGISGFALAVYGLFAGSAPRKWVYAGMVVLMFLLALGSYTPIYSVLFDYLPGFSRFRGTSKFAFEGVLFAAMLASEGYEALGEGRHRRVVGGIVGGLGLICGVASLCISGAPSWWQNVIYHVLYSHQSWALGMETNPQFMSGATAFSASQMMISCVWLLVVAALLFAAKKPWTRPALLVLVIVEMFLFGHNNRTTVDVTAITRPQMSAFFQQNPGDYRILDESMPNIAMGTGVGDIGGYDSFKLKRYAEFMAYSQGLDLNKFDNLMWPDIKHLSPLFRLVRLRYVIVPSRAGVGIIPVANGLPHLLLVSHATVVTGRDNILSRLTEKGFDPTQEVILEQPPIPAPSGDGGAGSVQLVSQTANTLVIDATLSRPAVLLITDSYSRSWKAVALTGSAQTSYQLLPADYILRAVPLSAGHHHIRLEFDPSGLRLGAVISLTALAIYLLLLVWPLWPKRPQAP